MEQEQNDKQSAMDKHRMQFESLQLEVATLPPLLRKALQHAMDTCDSHTGTSSNFLTKINVLIRDLKLAMELQPTWDMCEERFNAIKERFDTLPKDVPATTTVQREIQKQIANFPSRHLKDVEKNLQSLEDNVAKMQSAITKKAKRSRPIAEDSEEHIKRIAAEKIQRQDKKVAVANEMKKIRIDRKNAYNNKFEMHKNLISVLKRIYTDYRKKDAAIDAFFANPRDHYEELMQALGNAEFVPNSDTIMPRHYKENHYVQTAEEVEDWVKKTDFDFLQKCYDALNMTAENIKRSFTDQERSKSGYDISALKSTFDDLDFAKRTMTFQQIETFLDEEIGKEKIKPAGV